MQGQAPEPGALAWHWPEVRKWSPGCRAIPTLCVLECEQRTLQWPSPGWLSGDPRVWLGCFVHFLSWKLSRVTALQMTHIVPFWSWKCQGNWGSGVGRTGGEGVCSQTPPAQPEEARKGLWLTDIWKVNGQCRNLWDLPLPFSELGLLLEDTR